MSDHTQSNGGASDIPRRGWVDRYAPARAQPWLRLARLDRPIGTWLLLLPCWWSVALATAALTEAAWPNLLYFLLFAVGATVMRGAGCTWNDITDRAIDAQVARTRSRPIPSGQVTVWQAAGFMVGLSLAGLVVLLTLDSAAIWLGVISLGPVCVYPFAKRFTWCPSPGKSNWALRWLARWSSSLR